MREIKSMLIAAVRQIPLTSLRLGREVEIQAQLEFRLGGTHHKLGMRRFPLTPTLSARALLVAAPQAGRGRTGAA